MYDETDKQLRHQRKAASQLHKYPIARPTSFQGGDPAHTSFRSVLAFFWNETTQTQASMHRLQPWGSEVPAKDYIKATSPSSIGGARLTDPTVLLHHGGHDIIVSEALTAV